MVATAPSSPSSDARRSDPLRIPFFLGVAGRVELPPEQRPGVEAALRRALAWIAAPAEIEVEGLGRGLGLARTPIHLLFVDARAADGWIMDAIERCTPPGGIGVKPLSTPELFPSSAGEYVAAYCDVLLVWTDENQGSESWTIIESKRRAPGSRNRAGAFALDGSDNGPVLWIHPAEGSVITPLYPYDCRPLGREELPDTDSAWQANGFRYLQAVASNLERFNAEPPEAHAAEAKARLDDLLPLPEGANSWFAETGAAGRPEAAQTLQADLLRIFRLRSRASVLNRFYEARTVLLARRMFRLAFLAAMAVTFSDYWLPAALDSANPLAVPPHRVFLFTGSLAIIGVTWWMYRRFARTSGDERRNDYRAVAEGLRVQFYWTAAGTGASVASNYLQRQRGEVSWVRCAVSAVSFPYERAQAAFGQLGLAQQLTLLRAVREGWVHRQAKWFRDAAAAINAREAITSHLSFGLLWSGFVMNVLFFAAQVGQLPRWRQPVPGLLVASGAALLGTQWVLSRRGNPRKGFWQRFFPVHSGEIINRVVVITALTALCVGGAYSLGEWNPQVPSALKLLAILKNLTVAMGFLCGAWGGVMFFGENRRRYTAIGALFQIADHRAGTLLADLADAVSGHEAERGQQLVADLQALLIDLGREALADNTDWLLMRRNHPLEPIMV